MMKNKFSLVLVVLSYVIVGLNVNAQNDNASIIGTWLNKEDSKWKLVFTSDKCYNYYEGVLTKTSSYTISNTTPQCGESVSVEEFTSYLQLVNISDVSKICYEINGITSTILSIRPVSKGGAFVFNRQ